MVSGDLKAKTGKAYYCLAVCRQAAYWIDTHCADFTGDGISKTELLELLEVIGTGLDSLAIKEGSSIYRDYCVTKDTLAAAKSTVMRMRNKEAQ